MKGRTLLGSGFLLLAMLLVAVSVSQARQRAREVAVANAKKMYGGGPNWCINLNTKCNTMCLPVSDYCQSCRGAPYPSCKSSTASYNCDEEYWGGAETKYCGKYHKGKQVGMACAEDACDTMTMMDCGIRANKTWGITCPP
ncbi:MAG: hypothetical protein K2W96_20690 [Gemmataceae bacterium]|nr:hypothetical protein [Gemmataceae bacterium]